MGREKSVMSAQEILLPPRRRGVGLGGVSAGVCIVILRAERQRRRRGLFRVSVRGGNARGCVIVKRSGSAAELEGIRLGGRGTGRCEGRKYPVNRGPRDSILRGSVHTLLYVLSRLLLSLGRRHGTKRQCSVHIPDIGLKTDPIFSTDSHFH